MAQLTVDRDEKQTLEKNTNFRIQNFSTSNPCFVIKLISSTSTNQSIQRVDIHARRLIYYLSASESRELYKKSRAWATLLWESDQRLVKFARWPQKNKISTLTMHA